MYRDDLAATHARLEQLQRELSSASKQGVNDRQRIAQLSAQLAATQQALARMGGQMQQMQYMHPRHHYIFPSRAGTILTLGILSLVVCSVMGPIAWAMGNEEMRRMDMQQTPDDQRGSASAGRVCGIVASCLLMFTGFMVLVILGTAR
jgi:hypothetical protein